MTERDDRKREERPADEAPPKLRVTDKRRVRVDDPETTASPAAPPRAESEPDGPVAGDEAPGPDERQGGDVPPGGNPAPQTASADTSLRDARKETDEARAKAAEYLDHLQRLKAEFDNYRKRVLKEQTRIVESATAPLVARLLEVLDEFELALTHAGDQPDEAKGFSRGIEMVFAKLVDILRAEGLERIEAEGKPFDPELHEALLQGEGEGEPFVADVLRTGYTLKGRVIRPAGVKVARR